MLVLCNILNNNNKNFYTINVTIISNSKSCNSKTFNSSITNIINKQNYKKIIDIIVLLY